jgi:hypothetical protein
VQDFFYRKSKEKVESKLRKDGFDISYDVQLIEMEHRKELQTDILMPRVSRLIVNFINATNEAHDAKAASSSKRIKTYSDRFLHIIDHAWQLAAGCSLC